MKPVYLLSVRTTLLCSLLATCLPALAMGQKQDDPTRQKPVQPVKTTTIDEMRDTKLLKQYENRDPEVDARTALNKDDKRLLGFAGRTTAVPGVSAEEKQAAIDACGIHLMEGFGDTIKSPQGLQARHKAHKYAIAYNKVILETCFRKE